MRDHVLDRSVAISRPALVDYFVLTKPGIVGLVTVSTLSGIYLAGRGQVEFALLLWTMLGVALGTAGAAVLNNYIDRDIDSLMDRTSGRALVIGSVSSVHALAFGSVLVILSFAILAFLVNPLTAALTALAVFIYIVLYTMVLKRTSSAANQVGGLSGALPPVIGYAAATGTVGIEAALLFVLVAVWQQPHALSLALKYRDDYRAASIPVIPVAKGVRATKLRIALYTFVLLPVSILPYLTGMAGSAYLAVSLLAGLAFIVLAVRFLDSKSKASIFLFIYSIIYLTVVFTAMVLDMGV